MTSRFIALATALSLAGGCYGTGSVLDRADASAIDATHLDGGTDAHAETRCMMLCEACLLPDCDARCALPCADDAASRGTCASLVECTGDPPTDDGGVPSNEPPPGVVVCGGAICAAGEECCLLTGACVAEGDPSCRVPAGTTTAGACARNSDCAPTELCEATFDTSVPEPPVHGRGTCSGIVGTCVPPRTRGPDGSCGSPICGCDGRTYESVCSASEAHVRVAVDDRPCGAAFPPRARIISCREEEDCGGQHAHMHCDRSIRTCIAEDPLYPCGVDGQCPAGERCCGITGRCYDATSPASCAVPATGSESPCADDADCARWSGTYWLSRSEGEVYCDGPGPDGLACGTSGSCRFAPRECPAETAPVCGCDGTTYVNECAAQQASMRIASEGEC